MFGKRRPLADTSAEVLKSTDVIHAAGQMGTGGSGARVRVVQHRSCTPSWSTTIGSIGIEGVIRVITPDAITVQTVDMPLHIIAA